VPPLDSYPLSGLIADGAAALPQAQTALDSAWGESCEALLAAVAPFPDEWRGLLGQAIPARQVIVNYEIKAHYSIHKEASTSTTLQILPNTLAYERRFARAASHRQTIQFQVVAHPFVKEKKNG
jgi:hypothetical protein